jgi:hypothetical protein
LNALIEWYFMEILKKVKQNAEDFTLRDKRFVFSSGRTVCAIPFTLRRRSLRRLEGGTV